MGAAEISSYLSHLAVTGRVRASTQNQALSALLFLYRQVLGREIEWVGGMVRAKQPLHLPVVLTREEVLAVLHNLQGVEWMMASLLYGAGLRLLECCRLRVKDVDLVKREIVVREGKGAKDRYVPLPEDTLQLLRRYWVTHRNAVLIFPALGRGGNEGPTAKTHMALDSAQGAFRRAKFAAGITKRRVSVHTLRHCYATHLLEAGVNPRVIQRYMGHANLKTTMIYFHLTQKGTEDACKIINSTMKGFNYDNRK